MPPSVQSRWLSHSVRQRPSKQTSGAEQLSARSQGSPVERRGAHPDTKTAPPSRQKTKRMTRDIAGPRSGANRRMRRYPRAMSPRRLSLAIALLGCTADPAIDAGMRDAPADVPVDAPAPPLDAPRGPSLRVVTFNTGTLPELDHDGPPDDGYSQAQAELADLHYGNGLSFPPVIEDVRRSLATLDADLYVFQELFHSDACATIPEDARAGFVCEGWVEGDATVVQTLLGPDYQIACNLGKPDKCAAVHRRVGTFRGCDGALCLDGLAGVRVPDCGGGSRVGRGVIDRVGGGALTVVTFHGTSGIGPGDQACRLAQLRQVFEDFGLGDGPAANGEVTLVLGDFNTDPVRFFDLDESARYLAARDAEGPFHFVNRWTEGAPHTYARSVDIDHVLSNTTSGTCFSPGITPGAAPVTAALYFDHAPLVCDLDP